MCSTKEMFLKIFQNSQEDTCTGVFFKGSWRLWKQIFKEKNFIVACSKQQKHRKQRAKENKQTKKQQQQQIVVI